MQKQKAEEYIFIEDDGLDYRVTISRDNKVIRVTTSNNDSQIRKIIGSVFLFVYPSLLTIATLLAMFMQDFTPWYEGVVVFLLLPTSLLALTSFLFWQFGSLKTIRNYALFLFMFTSLLSIVSFFLLEIGESITWSALLYLSSLALSIPVYLGLWVIELYYSNKLEKEVEQLYQEIKQDAQEIETAAKKRGQKVKFFSNYEQVYLDFLQRQSQPSDSDSDSE
ncbi:MAG: hypothetical protein GF308_14435 [Candidatus Heimdallarchaeota archaeon]|nr:hypothetical protein [Candidatus Heimdallarchaeota archaeon]